MNLENRKKINLLIQQWPHGTVTVTSALVSKGFSNQLIQVYKNNRWIRSIDRGAYALYDDKVNWLGGIYALQAQLEYTVHPGGKTALELKGYLNYP